MKNRNSTAIKLKYWLLALILVVSACGRVDPPAWPKVISQFSPQQPNTSPQAIATSNHLVVYLDTSASMAGYVSADKQGQTTFSRTLQELRTFITIVDPSLSTLVRRVDSGVSAPSPDTLLSQASLDPATYTGKETDLAGAIGLFPKGLEQKEPRASGKDQAEDPPPPPRFHILVTDGVQSKRSITDENCTEGSDQFCVRKRILSLLSHNWGGFVIGLRSEFKGKIYSEITRGVVQYESRKRDPQTFRPFFIYLFSPDRPALEKLIGVLLTRLRPLAQEGGLRVLALTSTYGEGESQAELVIPRESSALLKESKVGRHQNPSGFTLRVDVGTAKSGPVPFQISATLPWSSNVRDEGTAQELSELVTWELIPLGIEAEKNKSQQRYPEIKIGKPAAASDGKITIPATAHFPSGVTGSPKWRSYALVGKLNLDQQTPPWIRQWSTNVDTTADTANKTLYLESALLGLWRNPELAKQTIARIYFRIGP